MSLNKFKEFSTKVFLLHIALFCLLAVPVAAQEGHRVVGVVSDEENLPLQGVAVIIKGENRGVVTDKDGRYVIPNVGEKAYLVYSYIGMKTQEILAGKQKEINVKLEYDREMLEETVVVGYSEVKYKDLTGSVGKANMNDMLKAKVGNIAETLAGRIAGVQVSSDEGMPGAEMNIVIRGNNSVSQSNSPLYVIDGFPLEDASIGTITPSDIESISVLKDASATAIYGARASNGVVIITTKLGAPGSLKVSFDASIGFSEISRKIELMNAYEFVNLQKEIMKEADFNNVYLPDGGSIEDYRNVKSIDWQDEIFRVAPVQSYSLNLSGGNKNTRHSTTLSIYDQDGIIKNSNYSRYSGRTTLDHRFGKGWHAQMTANYSRIVQTGESPSQANYSQSANLLPNMWSYRPFASVGDDDLLNEWIDPTINATTDSRVNPINIVTDEKRKKINNYFRVNAYVEYEVIKGLKLKVMGGFLNDDYSFEQFNGSKSRSGNKFRTDGVNASVQHRSTQQWVNENTITYNLDFGKYGRHKMDFLLGQTMQGYRTKNQYSRVTHIPNESLGMAGIGAGSPVETTYGAAEWTLMSFIGRVNYNYDNRYYFTGTFRADGSSKFAKNNRWGYFPSLSVAWNAANESFLKDSRAVSTLKIRASWGQTGNNRVPEYAYLAQMYATEDSEYPFGNTNTTGNIIVAPGNRDLKWETTSQYDAGIDLGFLNDRITATFDVYRKVTSDLLLSADIPLSSGFATNMMNVGKVMNRGLEISVSTLNFNKKNFKWRTDFNIAFNRNRVLELAHNQESIVNVIAYSNAYITKVGKPMGLLYGYAYDGTYKYEDFDIVDDQYVLKPELPDNGTGRSGIRPGDAKFKDINGDGTVNVDDCTVIGRGYPLHIGGFNNTFEFYGVDINVFFQWNYGNDILNAGRLNFMRGKSEVGYNRWKAYSGRWTEDNSDSNIPRVGGWGSGQYSSFEVEDGSYLRLKNLSIGYTFPAKLMKKAKIQKLRLYLSAQNLFTLSNYSGYDPEVSTKNTALTPGYDWSAYPRAKVYTAGLSIVF